jgi:hypothetical protein
VEYLNFVAEIHRMGPDIPGSASTSLAQDSLVRFSFLILIGRFGTL